MDALALVLVCCAVYQVAQSVAQTPVVTVAVAWKDADPPGAKYSVLRQTGNCLSAAATIAAGLSVYFYADTPPMGGVYCYRVVATNRGDAVRYSPAVLVAVGTTAAAVDLVLP
jgi:hypothetical protein